MDERTYQPDRDTDTCCSPMVAQKFTAPHPAAIARDREMAERRLFDLITALGHVFGPPTETAIHEAVVTVNHLQADAELGLKADLSSANRTIQQLRQERGEAIGVMVEVHRRFADYVEALEVRTKPSSRPRYVLDLTDLLASSTEQVRKALRDLG